MSTTVSLTFTALCSCSYTDQWMGRDTHTSSSQKKAQFKKDSSLKVHKWVSCLAVVDVNNSFTHIHNPLLLLIHGLMDGKGHACKLWSHWPCYNSTVQARGLCGSNPACNECLLFLHADPRGIGKQDRAEELYKDQQHAMSEDIIDPFEVWSVDRLC